MQKSFAKLFRSSHLGAVIATAEQIVDANDAFLRMIGYTRNELRRGSIDWRALTPPEFVARDRIALEQLRSFGVSVPYEKTFILRDGRRVEFVTGSVRLSEDPFTLASYTIDVSETNRLRGIKHELEARQKIVHQLAHELNNPLAALTFLLHILATRETLAAEDRELIEEAVQQLGRISGTVREVVAHTRDDSREDSNPDHAEAPLPDKSPIDRPTVDKPTVLRVEHPARGLGRKQA